MSDPVDVRVLRATCNESENGFRVHLTDDDWDTLVKAVRQLQLDLAAEREHSNNLQRGFDDPDGGPLARALARSMYHLEQQERRKAEKERDRWKKLAVQVRDWAAERGDIGQGFVNTVDEMLKEKP
jgi:hypothetical protein